MSRKLDMVRSPTPRMTILAGLVTIGASGAISSQTASTISGATVTQVGSEDGRYLVTVNAMKVLRVLACGANMIGDDDDAFPTTTGSDPQTRNLGTTGFHVQTKRVDTQADADPASGYGFSWWAIVALR